MEENEIPLDNTNETEGTPSDDSSSTETDNNVPVDDSSTNSGGGDLPLGDGTSSSTMPSDGMGDSQGEVPEMQNDTLQSKKVYKDCKMISVYVTGF